MSSAAPVPVRVRQKEVKHGVSLCVSERRLRAGTCRQRRMNARRQTGSERYQQKRQQAEEAREVQQPADGRTS